MAGVEDSESELAEADWDAHRPISNSAAYLDNDLVTTSFSIDLSNASLDEVKGKLARTKKKALSHNGK